MSVTETQPRITYREMRSRAEEIADEIIKERVLAGIAILNEKYGPDWVEFIDPARLSMSSASKCVLGQLYRDEAKEQEGYFFAIEKKLHIDPVECGFATDDGDDHDYGDLDEAWRIVLA